MSAATWGGAISVTDVAQAIRVTQVADGRYDIEWSEAFATAAVDIHAGTDAAAIDCSGPPVCRASGRAQLDGLPTNRRVYFLLRAGDGAEIVMGDRVVALEGGVNFRDLGGYATEDGRRVRWGRLFRSGHLAHMSESGLAAFSNLGISTICDFRQSAERARENATLPAGVSLESLEIPPGVNDPQYFHRVFRDASGPADVAAAVHAVVRSMVEDSAARYQRMFEVLLAPGTRNVLINCSAGKERTGVGAALILTALGVPRETIYYDFMLSAVYFPAEREIPRVLAKYEVRAPADDARGLVMPLLETRRSYLDAAFDFIDANFGDGLGFLREHYALGPDELASLRDTYCV